MTATVTRQVRDRQSTRRTRDASGSTRSPVRWWAYAVLVAVGTASIFPLYWSFVVASSEGAAASGLPSLVPGPHFPDNLARVVTTVDFAFAMQNSLIVASTVAAANVAISTLAGFAFAHLRFPGRNTLFLLVLGTAMIPAQLGVVPLYLVVSDLGWYGRLEAVIVPALAGAFGVFWMRQACEEAVDRDVVDAARLDGCSLLRVIWHVVLPAVRPQAVVLAMLTFMSAWNDFFWPLIVLDPVDSPTVQVVVSELASGYFTDYALMLTGATLGVLPVLAVFVLLARRIVTGIMHGAGRGVR
ncbi:MULTISPECIES: carbohydrate ABC transporter permease [Thermocrispum]|jgi:cellobiose transport system permease protein|uniref:Carbohydrate ABC transporter permease n=1 Tax=Thermocrispum agreste TaxID=37925 RepID=A0A2W4JPT6_9PSEU|nr:MULTISPECIES: carbohydrate ABC transporter permease [Thermocrispum]PZN00971.1 MAG: carbohydrate ABC transporter permease [Thermocrispum agreste]